MTPEDVTSDLSLLIPVFNGGKEFQECLSSIECLSVRTNVVILDDGSLDETYETACAYARNSKHKVRVIEGKWNRGYFRALKLLLRICNSRYFMVIGHDDRLSKSFLDGVSSIVEGPIGPACIFFDICTVMRGKVMDTWPSRGRQSDFPREATGEQVVSTFHEYAWGNLFIGIWSREVINYRTLFKVMRLKDESQLTVNLKKRGFLNDHMAVLRGLSSNPACIVRYNDSGVYYKASPAEKGSEGLAHFESESFLEEPLGYLSVVAYFMLPQIRQKNILTQWMLRYFIIYLGISLKTLLRRPNKFRIKVFVRGIKLLLRGYFESNELLVPRWLNS